MDELIEQVPTIVDAIRKQNWASDGLLIIDRAAAIAAVDQLVRTAYSAGAATATRETSESMLRAMAEVQSAA